MSLTELVKNMHHKAIKQRQREMELLKYISDVSSHETAEEAAERYAAEKHAYTFDGYLYQLETLLRVLAAGIPVGIALEAVDSCMSAEEIIFMYELARNRKGEPENANNFDH